MSVLVRKAVASDSTDILRIVNTNLDDYFLPEVIDFFIVQWPDGQFLATDFIGNPVGALVGARLSGNRATISLLAVNADARSKGVGTALINRFRQECIINGITSIQLEVRTTNESAIAFYKKQGFTILERLDCFYNNGGSAFRMVSPSFRQLRESAF